MDDDRVKDFEKNLWTASGEEFLSNVDEHCLFVLPTKPFVMTRDQASEAIEATPRWSEVDFEDMCIERPEEGMIVVAYHATAKCDGRDPYKAHCSSTYRRLGHDNWRIVQHQQTPPLAAAT